MPDGGGGTRSCSPRCARRRRRRGRRCPGAPRRGRRSGSRSKSSSSSRTAATATGAACSGRSRRCRRRWPGRPRCGRQAPSPPRASGGARTRAARGSPSPPPRQTGADGGSPSRRKAPGRRRLGVACLAAAEQPALGEAPRPPARWIAPSTPPTPSSDVLAALTIVDALLRQVADDELEARGTAVQDMSFVTKAQPVSGTLWHLCTSLAPLWHDSDTCQRPSPTPGVRFGRVRGGFEADRQPGREASHLSRASRTPGRTPRARSCRDGS